MRSSFSRPPIVVVLGHVDHGKTSLLDRVRNTNITSREAGGITQSIGAWQVTAGSGKTITFIDTPGHEAFSAMRARGAKIADIGVLVVAADDGVKPQTKESIKYLQEAETPFLVAVTKIDLPSARSEIVKNQLAEDGVFLEGRGGDVVGLEVSSKTGQGIDELLEMILLLADLHAVTADPEGDLDAVVVETRKDARRGLVVSSVVRNGTLRVGDSILSCGIIAKIRGLFNEKGKPEKDALPGTPVEILGFDKLPPVGSVINKVGQVETPGEKEGVAKPRKVVGFPVILKADTTGSLEAVISQLSPQVGVVLEGIGDVTESDVELAQATLSTIVGFNIGVSRSVAKIAQEVQVKIYTYKVIYELLQDVLRWITERQEEQKEKVLGRAEIIAQFPHGAKRLAGARILSGRIAKTGRLRLTRDEKPLGDIRAVSIKLKKEGVDKVDSGEFGVFFEPQLDFMVGDMIESFLPPKKPASQQ